MKQVKTIRKAPSNADDIIT